MKTFDRAIAMSWWNNLTPTVKDNYSWAYFKKNWEYLTGREIELIYKDKL